MRTPSEAGRPQTPDLSPMCPPERVNQLKGCPPRSVLRQSADPPDNPDQKVVWFLMRAAYGQERKAKDILEADNIEVFLPVTSKMRIIGGKRKLITESLIPNFLFVHTTERIIRKYVGSQGLSFLHHYYIPNKDENGCPIGKSGIKPLIIPDDQMEAFQKWYETEDENKMFISDTDTNISKGDKVKITSGKFTGFSGFVCRIKRQTRVGVTINGFGTIVTAYVPKAFLSKVTEQ